MPADPLDYLWANIPLFCIGAFQEWSWQWTTAAFGHAVMPGFHHSVAVSPFPLRKFHKNYVSAVRITLPMWKIPLRYCHQPLRRKHHSIAIGLNPIFTVLP